MEPEDVEVFKETLTDAIARAADHEVRRRVNCVNNVYVTLILCQHFFHAEMEGMNATSDESEPNAKTFTPNAFDGRGGYWLRMAVMICLYIVITDFGSKVFFYLIEDLVQPNRPKTENDFENTVLEISYFTIFVLGSISFYCFKEALNAVPTKIEVGEKALVVTMARAQKSELEDNYKRICIPMDSIASIAYAPGGVEGCLTSIFDETGALYVRPKRFFIVTETKTEKVIEKKVAKDQEKGMDLVVSEFRYFMLPAGQREEFIALVGARVGQGNENEDL